MSKFKDMVARDNARTFMNLDEFAEKRIVVYDGVTYDGEDHAGIPVVLSGLKEKDRRQLMSDHIQGLFLVSSVLHCRIQDLGGNQPEKGTRMEISDPDDATRNICKLLFCIAIFSHKFAGFIINLHDLPKILH